jgi:hypothetical protein
MRINVETGRTEKTYQSDAARARTFNRQTRRRAHGTNHAHSRHRSLLNQLEAGASAQEEDVFSERKPFSGKCEADKLVHGVVPADVLSHPHQEPLGVEESRGVNPAGRPEHPLGRAKPPG